MKSAFANAPVILSQRYVTGSGEPLADYEVRSIEIECNRVQNRSIDPSLKLDFVGLTTDAKGYIHLPVYDTVYRVSGRTSSLNNYSAETKSLGWFKSTTPIGDLPDVLVWKTGSKPRGFSQRVADVPRLSDATGTDSLELKSRFNTYRIGCVARGQADNTFIYEDGKGNSWQGDTPDLPALSNGSFMDHAVIELASPAQSRFEIGRVQVLDGQTSIPLNTFQSGSGAIHDSSGRLRLFSFGAPLPASVSLVLDVYDYRESDFRQQLPAELGAEIKQDGTLVEILHLAAGSHEGWSSFAGFHGDAKSINSSCELLLKLTGNAQLKGSMWVVLKDGRRWDLKPAGWLSAQVSTSPIQLPVKLSDIKCFEFLPYRKKRTIYFENLQLPVRQETLEQEIPTITFEVDGEARRHVSDVLSPLSIYIESHQGTFSGISSHEHGVMFTEQNESNRDGGSKSSVTLKLDGTGSLDSKVEYSDGMEAHAASGGSSMSSSYGMAGIAELDVPLSGVQSVKLKFSIRRGE